MLPGYTQQYHENILANGSIPPCILNPRSRWRCKVSFAVMPPTAENARWAPEPVWMQSERGNSLSPSGIIP
jgi:hypothetical protein